MLISKTSLFRWIFSTFIKQFLSWEENRLKKTAVFPQRKNIQSKPPQIYNLLMRLAMLEETMWSICCQHLFVANAFQKEFNKKTIKICIFLFAQANSCKFQEIGLAPVYPEDEKTRKLSKPFIALALIPELYFEIGLTALCFKYSDKSCESPLLDYADFF